MINIVKNKDGDQKKYMGKKLIVIMSLFTILLLLSSSYALWNLTLKQEKINTVSTACFKLDFVDENDITLKETYPISDEEGKKSIPYTFTITNICDTNARLQINLEILNDTTLEDLSVIKIMLDEKTDSLINKSIVSPTLDNAKSSYILKIGYLRSKKVKRFL